MQPQNFLDAAALLLVVTATAVALFRHFGLGSILGLLVAGMLLGPFTPGPTIADEVESLRHFTELGVVLLLFVIGLEMHPRRLWELRRTLFGLGSLQVLVTGTLLAGWFWLFVGDGFVALLVGFSLALSSTALVLQLLAEQGEMGSEHGQTAFSVLLMQDLAVVPMLALMPLAVTGTGREIEMVLPSPLRFVLELPMVRQFIAANPWLSTHDNEVLVVGQLLLVVLMLGLTLLVGRVIVPWALERLARQRNREAFLLVVMATVFIAAWAMNFAGMSMALGAFLMGMLLSGSRYSVQLQASVDPHKGLLMSLFFVAVGMSVDIAAVAADWWRLLLHLLVLIAVKCMVLYLLARRFGRGRAAALKVALLLTQAGEFGFIIFGTAKALGLIDEQLFVMLIALISISMLLTPLLARLAARMPDDSAPVDPSLRLPDGRTEHAPRVILAGYGRVGHTIGTILSGESIPYIAFESNAELVARWRNEPIAGTTDKVPVFYGDIRDPDLLHAVQVEQAEVVIITIDNQQATLEATALIRRVAPNIKIVVRARDLVAVDALKRAGATAAEPELVETSLRLAMTALGQLGVNAQTTEETLVKARDEDYALVRDELATVPLVPDVPAAARDRP